MQTPIFSYFHSRKKTSNNSKIKNKKNHKNTKHLAIIMPYIFLIKTLIKTQILSHASRLMKQRMVKLLGLWQDIIFKFQEACCSNDDHQCISEFFNPLL